VDAAGQRPRLGHRPDAVEAGDLVGEGGQPGLVGAGVGHHHHRLHPDGGGEPGLKGLEQLAGLGPAGQEAGVGCW
jgi:hypothetical protein